MAVGMCRSQMLAIVQWVLSCGSHSGLTGIPSRVAQQWVRWASWWWDASYSAYMRRDSGKAPWWWDKPWAWMARKVNRVAIPLALKLDKEAAVTEMVNQGWWG